MSATVNHHPENYQPTTRTMEIAERASGSQADAHLHEGNTKLVPWLMLACLVGGTALGVSISTNNATSHAETRMEDSNRQTKEDMREELATQKRFLQEYRIRVEDAEIAAEEVNPKFHPRRTE